MRGVEIPFCIGSVSQVGNRFPRAISVRPPFPVHQILQALPLVARVHDMLNFVLLLSILRDVGRTGSGHRLTREAIAIWLYTGDVDDRVYVHGAWKTEFNSIGPDQLHDGIGTEPPFRQLP